MIINRRALSTALGLLLPFTSHNTPILSNFLIQEAGGGITITAFNLVDQVRIFIEATDVVIPSDGLAVPAKLLAELVAETPDGDLNLKIEENEQESGKIHITAETSTFILPWQSGIDFPSPTPVNGEIFCVTIPAGAIIAPLAAVVYAASRDETKQILTGVYAEENLGGFAATDGHRLAYYKPSNHSAVDVPNMVIPQSAIKSLHKVIGNPSTLLTLSIYDGSFQIRAGNIELTSRVLNGAYPNYQMLIPSKFAATVRIDRLELLNAIKPAAVMLKNAGATQVITLRFTPTPSESCDDLVVQSSTDLGSTRQSVRCGIEGEVPEEPYGLNSQYLSDALKNLPGDYLTIHLNTPSQPVIIKNEKEQLALLMPMIVR